jgi:septum formation protein
VARLVLASASPRRRELLHLLVEAFDVAPSAIDETLGAAPLVDAIMRLALQKARAVAATAPDAVVLGADTVVVLDGQVFGKPADAAHARAMLHRLRGRWHEVVTGVAVVGRGREESAAAVSRVLMDAVDDRTIDEYVATGEPLDKAGAYAIQGVGGRLIRGLVGSYTNVIGLPLETTRQLLGSVGVPLRPAASL